MNVELDRIVKQHRGKLVGMGVLPIETASDAVEEIDFAVDELGFTGFMIGTHVNGKSISSKEYLPLFEEAEKKGAVIFIHPLAPLRVSEYYDLAAATSVIFPAETSVAALGIALNGHFDRFPNAKIVLAHLGGTVPYCLGRLDRATQTLSKTKLNIDANEYLRKFYLDTVSYYGPTFEYTADLWGSEKLLFGTDYPYAWGDNYERVITLIERSKYAEGEKLSILGENAIRIFKIQC